MNDTQLLTEATALTDEVEALYQSLRKEDARQLKGNLKEMRRYLKHAAREGVSPADELDIRHGMLLLTSARENLRGLM